jgi:hypothetical protein
LECGAPAPLFKRDATKVTRQRGESPKETKENEKKSGSGRTWEVNVAVLHAPP